MEEELPEEEQEGLLPEEGTSEEGQEETQSSGETQEAAGEQAEPSAEENTDTVSGETDRDKALEKAIEESRSAAGNEKAKDTNWQEN